MKNWSNGWQRDCGWPIKNFKARRLFWSGGYLGKHPRHEWIVEHFRDQAREAIRITGEACVAAVAIDHPPSKPEGGSYNSGVLSGAHRSAIEIQKITNCRKDLTQGRAQ